jgi:hypothetical protein
MNTLNILLILVVVGGLAFLFNTYFGDILNPKIVYIEKITLIIAVLEIFILFSSFVINHYVDKKSINIWLISLILLSVFLSIIPRITIYFLEKKEGLHAKQDQDDFHNVFLKKMTDFEKRVSDKKPLDSNEAFDLLNFCRGSNLEYRSLPDYSSRCFGLIERSFELKLIDPNGKVGGTKYSNLSGQTLYSYLFNVRAPYNKSSNESEIKYLKTVLNLFVNAGASVTEKDLRGETLRDYLNKLESL